MRRSLKVLLGGLALAASSVQAHAQQYWPNPYFQYPPPAMTPMGQSAINYRVVQPVAVYQQPIKPTVAAQPQVQPPAAIQPVRHQAPDSAEMPVVAPTPAAVPTIASLAAGQPTVMTSPSPAATTMPIGTAAEPLAPDAPPVAPVAEAKTTDHTQAPAVNFNDGCDDCGCWTVAFGAGVDIVKPHWKTNPALTISTFTLEDGGEAGPIPVAVAVEQTDFSYDCSVAPFVWASVQGSSGYGLRARGWWFNDSQALSVVSNGTQFVQGAAPLGISLFSGAVGDQLTVASSLRIRTFDLEGTYGIEGGNRRLQLSAGARYGYVSQDYTATLLGADPDDSGQISSGHNFGGIGPTLAAEGRIGLGTSGFALIGGTRGSLLFGTGRQVTFGTGSVDFPFAGGLDPLSLRQENDDLLPVWDLELGGEYSRNIGNYNFFVQAAFVAQVWFGAGNAANNDIITILIDSEVSDKNADLGLYGLRLTGGFRF